MSTIKKLSQDFQVFACLPFITLAKEKSIHLGPVIFWSASSYREFIPEDRQEAFITYINSIGQIKALVDQAGHQLINTLKVSPEELTCISIDIKIAESQKQALLIDALYLLYFACTYRSLYFGNEIPSFNGFRKIIPASIDFIEDKANWKTLFIKENSREDLICIHQPDDHTCLGFATILSEIYHSYSQTEEQIEAPKRFVRALRYFIDRLFPGFVNLVSKGLEIDEDQNKAEDLIFLGASLEALLDINQEQPQADFKYKLRLILHFKFARPLELFWKWVDEFYETRKKFIHSGYSPDSYFHANPNFVIPLNFIGIKLFIYAVWQILQTQLPPKEIDLKPLPAEEIFLYFFTEESLLRKIERYLELLQEDPSEKELAKDIHNLASLFVKMQQKNFTQHGIKFIPTPASEVLESSKKILTYPIEGALLPENFVELLQRRVA